MRVLLCSVAVTAIASHACAQPAVVAKPVAPNVQTEARALAARGMVAEDAGRYDEAIECYRQAYKLVRHSSMLYNIGNANRRAGHLAEAIAAYKQYLAEDPQGRKAPAAQALLVELEPPGGRGPDVPIRGDDLGAPRPSEPRDFGVTEAHEAAPAGAARATPPIGAPDQPDRSRVRLALGFVAGGVVATGVGIGFGLRAQRLADEIDQHPGAYNSDRWTTGQSAQRIAIVSYAVGGAALVTGAVLYWLGRETTRDRLAIAPWLSRGDAGIALARVW